ncbi:MAG: alpha-galactosidase, partial [Myxococcota bacterium]|nr:alpha-galactosidase [Myxococcota bacterium]
MKIKVCLLSCLFVSGLVGCSGTSDEACSAVAELSGQEVALTSACAGVDLTFAPQVQLDGVWTSADEAASLGTLNVALEDGKLVTSFTARADAAVGGLRLVGTGVINGRTGWLSNGFQSWSHSGMLALNGGSSEAELLKALTDEGDEEVLREGRALSWWHSAIGSATGGAVVTGVTEVARWRSWVKAVTPSSSEADALELWLVCGGAGESVLLAAGEQVHSEPWVLSAGNDVQALQRSYAAQVVSRERPAGVHAELGWNSWYDLWDKVGAQDVLDNAALAKTILEDEGQVGGAPLRIVVDDGWQQKWGVWETNAKFPDGLDGLATTLKAEGYHMGVWLAPLLVDPTSALAQNHPEWLVDGAAFLHPVHGALQVLDVTHPEAAAHLTRVIQTIVGWGYDLLKIDFLFAGTFQGGRYEPMPGMQAYAK